MNIYLAFAAPVGFFNDTNLPIIDVLHSYENVNIRNNNVSKYCENTTLEKWIQNGKIYKSPHFLSHISDVLRLTR